MVDVVFLYISHPVGITILWYPIEKVPSIYFLNIPANVCAMLIKILQIK